MSNTSGPSIEQILKERGSRYNLYGSYKDHAQLTQNLKDDMRNHPGWHSLDADMQETLDMVQHKIARVLNGDHKYLDNWDDMLGYITLVTNRLRSDPVAQGSSETPERDIRDTTPVVTGPYNPAAIRTNPNDIPHMVWPDDYYTEPWTTRAPIVDPVPRYVK